MAILKCTTFSDIHGQLIDLDAYERMMEARADSDVWFVPGDILNGSEVSPWGGDYPDTRLVDEHNFVVEFFAKHLKRIKSTAKVICTSGNHGKGRTERMWGSNPYHPDVLSLVLSGNRMEYLPDPNGGKSWQPVKAHNFEGRIFYKPGLNSWVTRAGINTVIGHFEQAAQNVETTRDGIVKKYLHGRSENARLIIQAHTHRVAMLPFGPYKYMEHGCMCHPGSYTDARGRSKWAPVHKGYGCFEFDTQKRESIIQSAHVVDLGYETQFNPLSFI